MALNVLKMAHEYRVEKCISALTSCGYRDTLDDLKEETFLDGQPNIEVEAHGLSKRHLFNYGRMLNKQFGFKCVSCIFNTAFGEYDSFDPNKTKVVGSFIKKFVQAKENNESEVVCWGDGKPTREIIYCKDAAEGIIQTLEKYDDISMPLNIGFKNEISIKMLAEKISFLVGYNGKIIWDTDKKNGQMRKTLCNERMKKIGIIINQTPTEEALLKTIEWYKQYGRAENKKM